VLCEDRKKRPWKPQSKIRGHEEKLSKKFLQEKAVEATKQKEEKREKT
jgi:hypothetical protein